MNSTQISILVVVLSLVLVAVTDARGIPVSRIRRSSSDQRIAELQALMALAQSGAQGLVAHGQYDPLRIGKRKRAFLPPIGTKEDKMRYDLVKAIVNKEAEELSRENEK